MKRLAFSADRCMELASTLQRSHHKWHTEAATTFAYRTPETIGLKGIEHKVNPFGFAALEGWEHGINLVGERSYDDEIVRGFLIQPIGYANLCSLTRLEYNSLVALQLLEP